MASQYICCSVRSLIGVNSVHLCDICDSLGDHLAWDLDAKVIMVLLGLLSASVHECAAVRHQTINNLKEAKKQN